MVSFDKGMLLVVYPNPDIFQTEFEFNYYIA